MATVGEIIDGKYEVLTIIGKGGMSQVFLARDRRLNKQWAVKEIQKRATDRNNDVVVQSAIAEANMIKQLDHPSIVRIVDIIETDEVIYIIEDFIEGETLESLLNDNGAQPQELVIEWAKQICAALEYLHTRKPPIIYRDMKPANVMLKPDGNIKIIDFGIAREYKEQSLSDTVSLGTRGYAAPEQFGGRGQTDPRTDVYCLGVTMYHLVTGHSPCDPPSEIYPIREWNPALDPGLEAIILKCTQLNPEDRYQSCAELLYALRHYQENGAAYHARQRMKLNSFIATACACAVFAATGVLGLVMQKKTLESDYNQLIQMAKTAATSEEKVDYYKQAIRIVSDDPDIYIDMIKACTEDYLFTQAELADLKNFLGSPIKKNDSSTTPTAILKKQGDYGQVAFEMGKQCWYFYQDEENHDDNYGIKQSVSWFKDAVDGLKKSGNKNDYAMAEVYQNIAIYKSDLQVKKQMGEDQGMHEDYCKALEDFIELVKEDSSEIVEVEAYRVVIDSIGAGADDFRRDGIQRERLETLLNNAVAGLENISTSEGTPAHEIKTEAQNGVALARDTIEKKYREDR